MLELKKGVEIEGRYVVHELIGSGGFGTVWKASDKQLGRDVALKRLLKPGPASPADDLKLVLDEARKHAQLVHTNIVQVYDVIEVDDEHLIVMEYVDGTSLHTQLRDLARRGGLLPLDRVVSILGDILSGVAFAHERQTVHRDLSPANILLTSSGIPKIADFGIARILPLQGVTPAGTTHTQAGTGNPHFMAPEQARGESADFGSDLFMVGIIGYLLLSGRHPFAHASGMFTIPEFLLDPNFIPDPPRAPSVLGTSQQKLFREYAAVVMRLLHREKAGRFASAQDAVDALEAIEPTSDCPNCGERVPDHYRFCGSCGSPLTQALPATRALEINFQGKTADDADALVERGFQASRLRRWWDAIALYRQAIALDREHAKAQRNLAFALNRLGKFEEAEAAASEGLKIGGQTTAQRVSLLFERSFARSNLKRYDDALVDINAVLNEQPTSARALYSRARIYLFMGATDKAIVDAQEVLRHEPDHNGAIRLLAQLTEAA